MLPNLPTPTWHPAPPTVAPAPRPRPADSPAYRLTIRLLRVALMVAVLLALAAAFFLFGEEREPHPVLRPVLTPAERAKAFRHPARLHRAAYGRGRWAYDYNDED